MKFKCNSDIGELSLHQRRTATHVTCPSCGRPGLKIIRTQHGIAMRIATHYLSIGPERCDSYDRRYGRCELNTDDGHTWHGNFQGSWQKEKSSVA